MYFFIYFFKVEDFLPPPSETGIEVSTEKVFLIKSFLVFKKLKHFLGACIKFSEYYNMSPNPIGNADKPIIILKVSFGGLIGLGTV